jgi:hypothetical protein
VGCENRRLISHRPNVWNIRPGTKIGYGNKKDGSLFFKPSRTRSFNDYDFDRENISAVHRYFLISFAICSGLAAFSSAKRKGAGGYYTHNAARDPSTYFLP